MLFEKIYVQTLRGNQRGLTLVELLAVILIIAIVSAIAFITVSQIINNTKKDVHIANAVQIIEMIKLAEASDTVAWESNPNGDQEFKTDDPKNRQLVMEMMGTVICPWENQPYHEITVYKKENNYRISIWRSPNLGSGPGDDPECKVKNKTENQLQQGRPVACQ